MHNIPHIIMFINRKVRPQNNPHILSIHLAMKPKMDTLCRGVLLLCICYS